MTEPDQRGIGMREAEHEREQPDGNGEHARDVKRADKVPYRDNGRRRHEYRLTESGADLLPLLHALSRWGQQYTEPEAPADAMQIVHLVCGYPTTDERMCDHCGQPVVREEEAWLRPWRSAIPFKLAQPVTFDAPDVAAGAQEEV